MNLMTEPVIKQPRHIPDTRTAKDWLDGLASGACDQRTFLRGLGDLLARSPDSGWEMLALLDQYYRRGRIGAETFSTLKAHLQNLLMGKAGTEAATPQIPTVRDELVRAPASASSVVSLPMAESRAAPTPVARPSVEPIRQRSDRPPVEGDVLRGRYRLRKLLGQGGTGSVFEALDLSRVDETGSEQRVALKVLHSSVMKRPGLLSELRREFQHLQALSHPNIVRVHEFDRDGDVAFFTMEYLRGTTLRRLLAAENPQGLDRPHALAIIRDVGAAIALAHSRNMVHGDLSPGNIFVTDNGEVRVLDFGATPTLRRPPALDESGADRPVPVEPHTFASCELLEGALADARDDVYALACVSYLLLAGHHPFQDISSLKARSLRISPRRPGGLSRRQWLALKGGLQLDRDKRPGDVAAWVAELEGTGAVARLPMLPALLATRAQRRGVVPWMVGGLAAALLGAAAWWVAGNVDAVQNQGRVWHNTLTTLLRGGLDARPRATAPITAQSPAAESAVSNTPLEARPLPHAAADAPLADRPAADMPAAGTPAAGTPAAAALPIPPPPAKPSIVAPPRAAVTAGTRAAGTRAAGSPAAGSPAAGSPAAPTDGPIPPGARARIELAADNVEVSPADSTAKVTVRRTRSLRGDASFSWWTESGTAKPGQDFVSVKSHVDTIPNGKASLTLLVPLVMDPARRQERNFYIVIDEPSDNAMLGARTLTMVTIPGPQPEEPKPE